jgi:nucleotide-binding universal stress UspA family protein
MAFKDVLLAVTTYPEPTSVSAIEDAVDFAATIGAKISAIACEIKIRAPKSVLGNILLDIPAMVAGECKKSATNARNLLVTFQHSAEKRGIFQDRILEHCFITEVPGLLVEYARLRDLMIVPAPDADYPNQSYAESIIFGSGRPTLVTPHTRRRDKAFALDTVVIAWDFSRPAARAVADALPILKRTKRACVLTVTNEKVIDTKRPGAELAKHLARHDVDVILDTVDAAGRSIGRTLESYIESHDANLLVMGAYGHSRVRDFILGGATKSMLLQPPIPIFLSH